MIEPSLLAHFPEQYTPTQQQHNLLKKLESGLKNNKFVVCCAPTGSGKSLIAKTLAGLAGEPSSEFTDLIKSYSAYKQDFGGNFTYEEDCLAQPAFGAFVLTITKSLQDQYTSLFNDVDVLKGKSNYTCNVDENFTVELAPCTFASSIKEDCFNKNKCAYYNARNTALLSDFATLNYKMFFSLPGHVKRKNIIVCDEASELEEELVRQFSAEINYEKLKQMDINIQTLITNNKERTRAWMYQLIEKINVATEDIMAIASKKIGLIGKPEKIKFQYLKNLHKSLTTIDSLWDKCDYIIDHDAHKVMLTPLRADNLAKYIFDYADKVILMSATIIDHKHFAKSLGIEKYAYIEEESDFDPQKSPIYVSSAFKLNYKNLKIELPKMASEIRKIVDHHKGEKGIIHTHTQEITNILREKLHSDDRYLFRDAHSTNEEILKIHSSSSDPTVLVSPSLTYGIDLKDDLARFQIIVKLPYLPLSSKRIKKMFDLDKVWYENKMLNSIVQASGRATRSKNDHSVTYILDGNFIKIISYSGNRLPKHFIDRIH